MQVLEASICQEHTETVSNRRWVDLRTVDAGHPSKTHQVAVTVWANHAHNKGLISVTNNDPTDPHSHLNVYNKCSDLGLVVIIKRLKRYVVRITQYCGFQNCVCVFLSGDVLLSLSRDYKVKHLYHFGSEIKILPQNFKVLRPSISLPLHSSKPMEPAFYCLYT